MQCGSFYLAGNARVPEDVNASWWLHAGLYRCLEKAVFIFFLVILYAICTTLRLSEVPFILQTKRHNCLFYVTKLDYKKEVPSSTYFHTNKEVCARLFQ